MPQHPDFKALLGLTFGTTPRYNIAPTQTIYAFLMQDGERMGARVQWGFLPRWSRHPAEGPINARAEKLASGPYFEYAFRRQRCLIPADVFYEWKRVAGTRKKQPYAFRRPNGAPWLFAGLWDEWIEGDQGDRRIMSCAIITTSANATVAPVHDRMPLILDPSDYDAWLDRSTPVDELQSLLRPAPDDFLTATPITTRVNNPDNDDAAVLEPVSGS